MTQGNNRDDSSSRKRPARPGRGAQTSVRHDAQETAVAVAEPAVAKTAEKASPEADTFRESFF